MESKIDKVSFQHKEKKPFKGIILDGRVYRAVVGPAFFQLCDRCDVRKDELCAEGTLGARLCNAFRFAYVGVPVRFRFSPTLTEALKNMEKRAENKSPD